MAEQDKRSEPRPDDMGARKSNEQDDMPPIEIDSEQVDYVVDSEHLRGCPNLALVEHADEFVESLKQIRGEEGIQP